MMLVVTMPSVILMEEIAKVSNFVLTSGLNEGNLFLQVLKLIVGKVMEKAELKQS